MVRTRVFLPPDWCIYIKRKDFGYIFQLFESRIHLNVEVYNLDWVKQFDMTSPFFFLF